MTFGGVSSATAREFQDFLSFKKSVPEKVHILKIFKTLALKNP